ncbi:Flap-structured DNA-binding and RNA-binding protein [Meristemomyces frigidus]|nr:Flap-structured DNA-binding and RNA-binding protein [Meristemomyces frigidus]
MSASNIIGDRNSTPAASSSTLRPPTSRTTMGSGHQLRASADMGAFSATSPLASRGIRPASEVYFNNFQQGASQGNHDDAAEKAAQQWIADIDQYEMTLEEMAAATLDQDFKDELSAIEQWFRVLSEPERTAALYALLQQTTQVQIRFFIQVLQQMAKSHPMSGVLSPAAFNEKDPMSSRMNDAMSKLNVEGSRASFGFGSKPPPSPGAKRNSGLDPSTIKSMFPDAANAIEGQKAEYEKTTGTVAKSNRNSTIGDRSSVFAPTIPGFEETQKKNNGIPDGPWRAASQPENQPPIGRPKSSAGQEQQGQQPPMGQFGLSHPPPSAGLRSARPFPLASNSNSNIQSTSIPTGNADPMGILSPYAPGGSWASAMNTPMVPNFNMQQHNNNQADMIANATAMKLAALSTVNNRIQLDDVRKFRRTKSTEGQGGQQPFSPGLPSNILMTNEYGQILTPQQAAALQQQQIAAMQGRRSRPSSPGIAITGPAGMPMGMPMQQSNGFLSTFDGQMGALHNGLQGMNLAGAGGYGGMGSMSNEGYLSDASGIERGRSPRGRRGSSKPPEDPTDLQLLKDVPNWLRTLRLHKYTDNLKDMRWQDLVQLDEDGLEKRGVAAKGARTKLLKASNLHYKNHRINITNTINTPKKALATSVHIINMYATTARFATLTAAMFATTSFSAPTTSFSATPSTYSLVADYSGSSFFDSWSFFNETGGDSDPTEGFVSYQSLKNSAEQDLVGYVYNAQTNATSAYIGVDHTNNVTNGRPSVRLTSAATFSEGALIIADVLHMPLGICGTWGAFWTVGPNWPSQGEIDILEGVNDNDYNSMTLHTAPGCAANNASNSFLGTLAATDCDAHANGNAGCGIVSPKVATLDYGHGQTCKHPTAGTDFNKQGGAVYATLWTSTGISIYMFPYEYVPSDIASGKPDPSSWTVKPLAHFGGSGCDYMTTFSEQALVINTDFCGSWGGKVWPQSDCAAKTQTATCEAYVASNPAAFTEAYWNIASIKVYQTGAGSNTVAQSSVKRSEPGTNFGAIQLPSQQTRSNVTHYNHHHGHSRHGHPKAGF